ncbi:hypothetical protein KUCAC02_006958 [Chaenocephalus aceratus]|uniref:Uncharacterized protein n=1 Tax=Chaenocephalus aceratus TaxID=36190 RepID=A0ACB9VUC1_CHAAC|nr:hypothetical protein KUCAC02_006958 [Chaenocephalus aceratus]
MASTTACTEAVPLVYPQEVKHDSARKAYKLKLLKDRPETLFADLYKSGEVSNLIFLTDQPIARTKTPLDQKGTPLDHHPDNTHGDKIILIFFHTMPH